MSNAPGWSFAGLAPSAPSPTKDANTKSLLSSFTTPVPSSSLNIVEPATEKAFAQTIDPRHVAISSQRRLIAIATGDKQIECFRFNGSRAFWHKRSGYASILALSWLKHKGYLQVAWFDGKLELLNTKTGKPVRTLQIREEDDIEGLSLLHLTSTYFQPQSKAAAHTLNGAGFDEAEALISLLHGSGSSPGLFPSAFAWFDIQEELPRLSVLPVISEDRVVIRKGLSDSFVKQDLLDEFGSKPFSSGSDETICALSMGVWSDGIVSFIDEESEVLHGSFSVLSDAKDAMDISNENNDQEMGQKQGAKISQINHAWNSASSRQAFLAETASGDEQTGHQHTLLINFAELDTHVAYFKQLTFLLKRVQTLSNYILQVIVNVRTIYQGWRRVPGTWINAGNDMLKESTYKHTLPEALYRFAVTADMVEPLIEWVKEWIAPAGNMQNYDRWRVAIHDGYTSILDAMHNCLLPAIDRAAVVQNRLKVLNRMPAVRLLNIDQSVFTRMNDTLDTLRLLGHATMKFAATESRQFDAFAPWLQKTLQCANGETRSTTGEYLIDKLADADLLQILPYITGALNESKLEVLLASASIDMVKMVAKDAPVMVKDDITDLMIKHRDNTLPKDTKHSPEIDILFHGLRWRAHVERVIEAVQKEFMQSVKKQQQPSQTQLSRIMDIRSERRIQSSDSMPGKVDQDVIFTAGAVAGMNNTMIISSLLTTAEAGQASAPTTITFAQGNLTQICFVDSNFLLVLLRTQSESRILKIPYYLPPGAMQTRTTRALNTYRERCKSIPHIPERGPAELTYTPDMIAAATIVAFEHKDGFIPGTIIYEEGKMAILDESGKRIKIYFDLDVVHEEELGMQGNPDPRDVEEGLDYWADQLLGVGRGTHVT